MSEHEHYWPYGYLKIMTWDKAIITDSYYAGTFEDLKRLGQIVTSKLASARPGDTFSIDKEYSSENTVTTKFFMMQDDFDPDSMDELIMSERQEIVNKSLNKG